MTGWEKTEESLLRKTAKESQQAIEEKYRLINENMKDVIWQSTFDLVITYVTFSVKKLLGYEPKELIGRPLTYLLTPAAQKLVLDRYPDIMRRLAEHEELDNEIPFVELIRKDGTTVWTEVFTDTTFDSAGQFLGFQGVTRDISKLKKAEDALRESERFLRQSEKIARTGGWKANPTTDSLHWSEGVYNIVEAPQDYQPGLDEGLEFYAPPYRPILKGALAKTIELNEPFSVEAEVITAGGKHLWTEVRGLMREEEGEGPQVIGSFQDITERKLAEEALGTSESKYRLLFDIAPIGIILVDTEGKILEVNTSILKTLGSPGPEATKSINMLTFPPLAEAGISDLLRTCMTENRSIDTELFYTSKWGKELCLRIILTPKLNEQGDVSGCLAVMEDISERQLAELALRVSESKFRTLFEAAQDAIFIKDLQLKYVDINPSGLELFQSSRNDLIGKTSREFFGKNYPEKQDKIERRVIQGQAVETYLNWEFQSQPISLHLTRFPLRDSHGEIMGICGVAREIFNSPYVCATQSPLTNDYKSDTMRSTLAKVRQASETDSIVLMTGETGTGKDYLARYIHELSARSAGPFYAINCAAIPPELAESELFGHETGAYTNAIRRKKGMLEMAEGGTLLLNEIGELTPLLQAKLLTFLDTFSITRVGGEKTISVNARLIAATNRDLWAEVNEGRFRKDLYYRISVISIEAPPLRERIEDIPVIANSILIRLREELKLSSVPDIRADAMRALCRYTWPGNVREVRNVLERALMLSGGDTIFPNHLRLGQTEWVSVPEKRSVSDGCSLNDIVEETERLLIEDALGRSRRNKSEAARLLGVSRFALLRRMTKLGIS